MRSRRHSKRRDRRSLKLEQADSGAFDLWHRDIETVFDPQSKNKLQHTNAERIVLYRVASLRSILLPVSEFNSVGAVPMSLSGLRSDTGPAASGASRAFVAVVDVDFDFVSRRDVASCSENISHAVNRRHGGAKTISGRESNDRACQAFL